MCEPDFEVGLKPEERLANLVREELGVEIDKHALRLFLEARWTRVARLAHAIHEKAESHKAEA